MLRGNLIEPPRFADFFLAAVLLDLPLAEFFQHADFAIGLDQRLAAALDLTDDRLALLGDLPLLCSRHQVVALGLDEAVDIDAADR